ncbi:U1-C [Hexamita inflata]|uniref:C2H2-type zinc finger n=1 Tax=Hexamita inflata TaxID=28002 RepID=A0AA86TAL6_9EUKA|nr:C2H2-type zinc finger [Hexamita inflata]
MGQRKFHCPYCNIYLKRVSIKQVQKHNQGNKHVSNYIEHWKKVMITHQNEQNRAQ